MTDALSGLAKYQHNLASRKHQDIVIAATHVFLKQGYDGATVDAVAQQASVSLATLYKHFPTKADLYGAALGNVVSQLAAQAPHPSASSDPVKALTALGKAYGELLLDPQTLGFLRLIIAEQTRFPELGAEMYERGKLVAQGPVHDIRLALPISIAEAVDGAKVQVPTISGRVWVTIPAGSNSGTVLRLAGKGLDRGDGESGHQFIELIVMLPDSPDTDLADFVRRWPAAKSFDPRAAVGLS